MALRPGTVIRPPRVSRIHNFHAQLRGSGILLLLKQFGVIVDRALKLFVVVVKREFTRGWSVKVDPAFMLLQAGAAGLQWWIVALLGYDLYGLLARLRKIHLIGFLIGFLAPPAQWYLGCLPRSGGHLFFLLDH